MKKIILSLVVIAAVAAIAGGATYAYFTSTKTVTGNTFTAGTLDVLLTGNNTTDNSKFDLGTVTGMAPGESTGTAVINIENNGTLPLAWFGYFTATQGASTVDMTDVVYIKSATTEFLNPGTGHWEYTDEFIKNGTGFGTYESYYTVIAESNVNNYHVITLKDWNTKNNAMNNGNGVMASALKPGYKYRFSFQLGMVGAAGNDYQGQSMDLSYTVKATQVNVEALANLFASDTRLAGTADFVWLNQQLGKQ